MPFNTHAEGERVARRFVASKNEQVAVGYKVTTRVILRAVHGHDEYQSLASTSKQDETSGMAIERIRSKLVFNQRAQIVR